MSTTPIAMWRCDLLKNIYLCGSNNNAQVGRFGNAGVVICLKISIFVVATTTGYLFNNNDGML